MTSYGYIVHTNFQMAYCNFRCDSPCHMAHYLAHCQGVHCHCHYHMGYCHRHCHCHCHCTVSVTRFKFTVTVSLFMSLLHSIVHFFFSHFMYYYIEYKYLEELCTILFLRFQPIMALKKVSAMIAVTCHM